MQLFSVGITGGLHEDGLADAADAFGGGWNRERVLEIMKVSRIGSYGALALIFSVGLRILLLASLPVNRLFPYVVAAEVLARWTILPLGKALPGARDRSGLGAQIARQISTLLLIVGTTIALFIVAFLLRFSMIIPVSVATLVIMATGFYYKRRIRGISGDCFGATIQLTAIAVYLCGVWQR